MRKGGREDHVTPRWRHTHPARPPRHTEILLTWSESPTAAGPKPTGPGRAAIYLEAAKLTEFSRQYRQTRFIGRRWFDNRQDGSAAVSNTRTDAYERLTSTLTELRSSVEMCGDRNFRHQLHHHHHHHHGVSSQGVVVGEGHGPPLDAWRAVVKFTDSRLYDKVPEGSTVSFTNT